MVDRILHILGIHKATYRGWSNGKISVHVKQCAICGVMLQVVNLSLYDY